MASPKPSSQLRRFASTVLLGSVVVTAILGSVRQLKGFETAEFAAYDRFIRLRPQPEPDPRILIVGITEDDLRGRQEYPIQDGTLAELLSKLESYGPRAIGLDVARDIPIGPAAGRQQLTDVISQSDRIVSVCLLSSEGQPGLPPAPGTPPANTGFAGFSPDQHDGIVRRSRLVSQAREFSGFTNLSHLCNETRPDLQLSSFSFLLSMLYLDQEGIRPEPDGNQQIQLKSTLLNSLSPSIGSYIREDITDYQLMLNYRAAQGAFPQVSLSDVLSGNISQQEIQDKVVLIGYTSQVEKDVLQTPYIETAQGLRNMTGVVLHGQAVSQLLSAVLDGRPLITSWSEPGEMLWIWLWALAGGTLAFYYQRPLVLALLSGSAIASCWGLSWFLFQQGLWVPLVPTAWGILLTALGVLLFRQARQGGYAQAIYEQLREQLSNGPRKGVAGGGSSLSYLEDLVQRARRVRQGEEQSAGQGQGSPELDMAFDAVEQQGLYDQIRAEVEAEVEAQQASRSRVQREEHAAAERDRIQALLNRAQSLRAPQQGPGSPDSASSIASAPVTSPTVTGLLPTSLLSSSSLASEPLAISPPVTLEVVSANSFESESELIDAKPLNVDLPDATLSDMEPPGTSVAQTEASETMPASDPSFVIESMPAIQPVSLETAYPQASLKRPHPPE